METDIAQIILLQSTDETLIICYTELRSWWTITATTKTDKLDKSYRPGTTLRHFHGFWKENERFYAIFPLQEHQRLSACLPACFSGMSLPTWHFTRALHWCRQWAIPTSSMIAMIWVGKSITRPPGKRRTPGCSLTPGSAIIQVFFLPVYTNLPPLSYGAHKWLGIV